MSVQKPEGGLAPGRSCLYSSGRPRSWPNSWQKTPMPPSSGLMVYGPTQTPSGLSAVWVPGIISPTQTPGIDIHQECAQMASLP